VAKENVSGKVDEVKGKVKQGVGNATGNPELHDEGVVDEAKGNVKQAFGNFKDTVTGADKATGSDVKDK
jgi:uncharacterized protein YjbJ (UPF0337 family)